MNTNQTISRRTFLKTSALAGAAVSVRDASLQVVLGAATPPAPQDRALTPSWVDKPMRWAQLTLVEDDPGQFDLKFWLDYFKRTHSDAVCLSGGGCVAYYPTKIPGCRRPCRWRGRRRS